MQKLESFPEIMAEKIPRGHPSRVTLRVGAHMIRAISYEYFGTTMITVPRWFESSMTHEAAINRFLFWIFAGYLFRKPHSTKCFFGAMGKSFEMILKSFFSVWLCKDDYCKLTSAKVSFEWPEIRYVRKTLVSFYTMDSRVYNHRSWKLQILCHGQNQFWPMTSSFIAEISN